MEILSVTLKNFKAHGDRQFHFNPGTNAICGENGAGKTSILEAIAWTLFNYRGNYRKDDLIRNGCRSAQATISFVSSKDQRTYNVQRCTSKGYILFDPQLNQRLPYSRIDEEVLPWLREHLGVATGTDLARLFENTIGVPQGMLTADFLLSGEKRKRVFDAILKVEDYKQVSGELGSLQKYAEGLVDALERDIRHYDDVLRDRPDMETRCGQVQQEIEQSEKHLHELDEQLTGLSRQKTELEATAKTVQALEQKRQQLTTQLEGYQREHVLLEAAVERSQQAIQLCEQHRASYDHYLQAEKALATLQAQQQEQTALLKQRQSIEKALAQAEREAATLAEKWRQIESAERTIATLQPLIQQQEQLEAQKQQVEARRQELQQNQMQRETLGKHLQRLRQDWKALSQTIKRIQSLEAEVMGIGDLEQQRDRLQSQLSRVEVAKQFEVELREIVTAIETQGDRHQDRVQEALTRFQHLQAATTSVSEAMQAAIASVLSTMESGQALTTEVTTRLHTILADLTTQVSAADLKQQQQAIRQQLQTAYQQRSEWETLAVQKTRLSEIQAEGEETQEQIDDLGDRLQQREAVETELTQVTHALTQLNDPRQQCQLLGRELTQKDALEAQQGAIASTTEQHQSTLRQLDAQLVSLEALSAQIEAQTQQRQQHHESYLIYLQHQQGGAQLQHAQTAVGKSTAKLTEFRETLAITQNEYETASQNYDPQEWQDVEQRYNKTRSQADQIRGRLPQQKMLLDELEKQLSNLKETAAKRDRTDADLSTKQRNRDFISFARKAYKEAGPRITERYVQAISREADRLFRELLNRQNVALEWTRDYEIMVQEGAHLRRFVNLSGGEQMCAALAVRLALLRVLADIDIAFFDEPTTNMDRARRESLAEAIANLKTFRQLFVISHDDTFEQFTEHVVLVQRNE